MEKIASGANADFSENFGNSEFEVRKICPNPQDKDFLCKIQASLW